MEEIILEAKKIEAAIQSKGQSSNEIYESIYQIALKEISNRKETTLVDMGCGTGSFLDLMSKRIPELKLYGSDIHDFRSDDQKKKFEFHQCDFDKIGKENQKQFDVVTSIEVIEHLENPRAFIRSLSYFIINSYPVFFVFFITLDWPFLFILIC